MIFILLFLVILLCTLINYTEQFILEQKEYDILCKNRPYIPFWCRDSEEKELISVS